MNMAAIEIMHHFELLNQAFKSILGMKIKALIKHSTNLYWNMHISIYIGMCTFQVIDLIWDLLNCISCFFSIKCGLLWWPFCILTVILDSVRTLKFGLVFRYFTLMH